MLYLVSTPIGNLGDISERAKQVLSSVDLIVCEDTRRTGLLLFQMKIKKRMITLNETNERRKTPLIMKDLEEGKDLALVSDGGTPLISDPGYLLVREARKKGVKVTSVPGPSALISALSVSGFPTNSFSFYGFIPKALKKKKDFFSSLKGRKETIICYESPYRLIKTITVINEELPTWQLCVVRELTKKFEEIISGTASELLEKITKPKGEYVLILHSKGMAP